MEEVKPNGKLPSLLEKLSSMGLYPHFMTVDGEEYLSYMMDDAGNYVGQKWVDFEVACRLRDVTAADYGLYQGVELDPSKNVSNIGYTTSITLYIEIGNDHATSEESMQKYLQQKVEEKGFKNFRVEHIGYVGDQFARNEATVQVAAW